MSGFLSIAIIEFEYRICAYAYVTKGQGQIVISTCDNNKIRPLSPTLLLHSTS